jgi:4-hydroxybenzoate polyprenyltransferase
MADGGDKSPKASDGGAKRDRSTAIPLAVDLDGTLIKSDLLLESFLLLMKKNPLLLLVCPVWLLGGGKQRLKQEIATRVEIDAARLPYHPKVIDWLSAEREGGRTLVLATASHRLLAEPVAAHLGLFDEVLATDETTNLKGPNKLAALQEKFGEDFGYAGDTDADVPLWKACRERVVVASPSKAASLAKAAGVPFDETFHPEGRGPLKALIKATRPHQWAKNLLLFVPALLAHRITDLSVMAYTALAFMAFSLLASSVYVLNDLLDIPSDRHHHRKKTRPFASGDLSILTGFALLPVLLGAGITLTALLPVEFWGVMSVYYAITLAYSLILKSLMLLDVMVLAGLYTVRILAGSAATDTKVSFWLFAFSMFVFLCLAFVKRYIELWTLRSEGRDKSIGRGYRTGDIDQLQSLGSAAGYVSVLVLALYLNSPEVRALYSQPAMLWAIIPLLTYWISRIWLRAGRGEVHDDPIVYALKDPASWVIGVLACVVVLLAR